MTDSMFTQRPVIYEDPAALEKLLLRLHRALGIIADLAESDLTSEPAGHAILSLISFSQEQVELLRNQCDIMLVRERETSGA